MLFEELSETFPAEVVEPYGEVLIVPAKAFKPEWRSMLEAEGVQIYTNAYRGQVCFFLRKKASNQAVQEKPQPNVETVVSTSPNSTPKTNVVSAETTSSNVEDAVVQLVEQGLGFKEIQQRLGLTSGRLMGVFSSLSRKGVLQKLGWVPERRKRKPSTREAKVELAKPSLNTSSLSVREMLQASLKILDEHPRVAKFLLEKCVEALT
jgi:CHAT domain-containing protein